MRLDRRGLIPWLVLGSGALCLWCSFLSAAGGWLAGSDIAGREARARYEATAAASQPELPELGVLVTRLDRGGPAALAGVARGDLIVAIDGAHVQDARDLRDQLQQYAIGDTVRLTLLRGDGEQGVSLRLDPFPGDGRRPYLGIYFTARGEEPADL